MGNSGSEELDFDHHNFDDPRHVWPPGTPREVVDAWQDQKAGRVPGMINIGNTFKNIGRDAIHQSFNPTDGSGSSKKWYELAGLVIGLLSFLLAVVQIVLSLASEF